MQWWRWVGVSLSDMGAYNNYGNYVLFYTKVFVLCKIILIFVVLKVFNLWKRRSSVLYLTC